MSCCLLRFNVENKKAHANPLCMDNGESDASAVSQSAIEVARFGELLSCKLSRLRLSREAEGRLVRESWLGTEVRSRDDEYLMPLHF